FAWCPEAGYGQRSKPLKPGFIPRPPDPFATRLRARMRRIPTRRSARTVRDEAALPALTGRSQAVWQNPGKTGIPVRVVADETVSGEEAQACGSRMASRPRPCWV